MSDKIKEALQKLDVTNDNHWTQDGLAKLETVKFLNSGEAVTREQLDEHFPNFNRTTAAGFFMDTGAPQTPAAEEPPVEPAAPATAAEQGSGEQTESPLADGAGAAAQASQPDEPPAELPPVEAEQPEVDLGDDGSDEVEALEEAILQAEEQLDGIRREIHDLSKVVADGEVYVGKMRTRLSEIKPKENGSATIAAYLDSIKQRLAQRGENRAALKASGLTLKSLAEAVGKSPIDNAMARKTARGGRRPVR